MPRRPPEEPGPGPISRREAPPVTGLPTPSDHEPGGGPNVVLAAYAKNEGRFLLEWLAYHRLIGVRDILVYTNDCEDESQTALLSGLRSDPRAVGGHLRGREPELNPRAGFSLIEALIVLIVGAMALILIFGVGGKANETAFRLGRRALSTADNRLATDSLRAIISGAALSPADAGADSTPSPGVRFAGDAAGFRTDAMLDVATPCAPSGPASDLSVEIVRSGSGSLLTCRVGQGPTAVLLDLGAHSAGFSYSLDGQVWSDRWAEPPGSTPVGMATPHERRLYVRLASDDGAVEITGRASSDRPDLQPHHQQVGPAL
jgi:hypothetical protein